VQRSEGKEKRLQESQVAKRRAKSEASRREQRAKIKDLRAESRTNQNRNMKHMGCRFVQISTKEGTAEK
jgi:hypothetical protein